jgi:acyl-CoA thioester hydrolase
MERVKINLPAAFSFSTKLKVRISDVNYGGHVGNDSFLSIVHEARLGFLAQWHYTEMNVEGVGLIMADVQIEFKKELLYGNELEIQVAATNFDRLGFDIFYLLEVVDGNNKTIAAKVKTGMMCFDYATKKKASLPEKAMANFSSQ